MAQWIKSLVSKHDDLSLNPQPPHKTLAGDLHHNLDAVEGKWRQIGPGGLAGQSA